MDFCPYIFLFSENFLQITYVPFGFFFPQYFIVKNLKHTESRTTVQCIPVHLRFRLNGLRVFFCLFLGPHLGHMEVSRLGV